MPNSAEILERLRLAHGKDINLGLRPAYTELLRKLGNPEKRMPPAIIVAGTNGKGSTCAFLRAITEASGYKAHVYSSPHLVTFHERIRIAGSLINEEELCDVLSFVERNCPDGGVSVFEAATAAAFLAFANHQADVTILEVGLGGRLDATNIVPSFLASVITRLSFDHRSFLGNSMKEIAREKAGVMRPEAPCITAAQPSGDALESLRIEAASKGTPLIIGAKDWSVEMEGPNSFRFTGASRSIDALPLPALIGGHQIENAGLAIAASAYLPFPVDDNAFRQAMTTVEWPGRLQNIKEGALRTLVPAPHELWLDGGHNDSAGEVLAVQMNAWQQENHKPIDLVFGMLSTKEPMEFLSPLMPYVRRIRTVRIDGEVPGFDARTLADIILKAFPNRDVSPCGGLPEALTSLRSAAHEPRRILVCGSLYLAGKALAIN